MAFVQQVETIYNLDAADVIVSLDADFLCAGFPGTTRYARDFAKRRDPDSGKMNRLFAVESTPSATGAKADHRLPLRASAIEKFADDLHVGVATDGHLSYGAERVKFLEPLASDLAKNHGASAIIPGDHQPPTVHALAHAMNAALGNVGKTVFYSDPVLANTSSQSDSLKDLVSDMRAGKVDLLIILGGNPVYDAPADF